MPNPNKLRVDTSYKAEEEGDIPMTFCNIDFIHSGDKSAFTPVKQNKVSSVVLEDTSIQQHVSEHISKRKNAYRMIKDLFKAQAKQVCPCIKDKKQTVSTYENMKPWDTPVNTQTKMRKAEFSKKMENEQKIRDNKRERIALQKKQEELFGDATLDKIQEQYCDFEDKYY